MQKKRHKRRKTLSYRKLMQFKARLSVGALGFYNSCVLVPPSEEELKNFKNWSFNKTKKNHQLHAQNDDDNNACIYKHNVWDIHILFQSSLHKQPNLGRVIIYKMSPYNSLFRNTESTGKITQHEIITLMQVFDYKLLLVWS